MYRKELAARSNSTIEIVDNAACYLLENEMNEQITVPNNVELIYRVVGKTHVFSSKGIRGLVHIGSHDRQEAFTNVIESLGAHVSAAYGCEAAYKCAISYTQFEEHIDADNDIAGNFLIARLDETSTTCV